MFVMAPNVTSNISKALEILEVRPLTTRRRATDGGPSCCTRLPRIHEKLDVVWSQNERSEHPKSSIFSPVRDRENCSLRYVIVSAE